MRAKIEAVFKSVFLFENEGIEAPRLTDNVLKSIIDSFEIGLLPKNTVKCEPQLGKRNLYPSISQKGGHNPVKTRMDFLAYADGKTPVFEIAKRINKSLELVNEEMRILFAEGLIEFNG